MCASSRKEHASQRATGRTSFLRLHRTASHSANRRDCGTLDPSFVATASSSACCETRHEFCKTRELRKERNGAPRKQAPKSDTVCRMVSDPNHAPAFYPGKALGEEGSEDKQGAHKPPPHPKNLGVFKTIPSSPAVYMVPYFSEYTDARCSLRECRLEWIPLQKEKGGPSRPVLKNGR